jgi:hypothetical protein
MENKYSPLTEEQFVELQAILSSLGAYLPENKAPFIWDMFNAVRNETETRPCTCSSAGAHWKRAIDHLMNWVKEKA